MEDNLKKVWQTLSEDYELPDYDTFREDMKNEDNLRSLWTNAKKNYDLPEYEQFKADMFGDDVQAEGSQYFDNDGTVVDQAVDNMNRMTGHMPQAVQDVSFNGPVYNQKVNPPGGQATFTEEELAEQIAATQKENQPTINATDTSGMAWTNAEVANMRNDRKRENPNKGVTYQQKESWMGSYARTPDEFGEMHYGWQRGQRVKRLNKQGVEFAGYGGHKGNQYYNEALDAAERMSDDEIVATYEKISKSLGPDTDLRWLVNTEEGYKAASQLKALQHELHARDLGFAHDRDVKNAGAEDYASVRTDQMVADRIDAIASMSPQERDALAQEAYDRNLDSEGMALDDQNTMLAVAALRSKENGRRVEENYRELQQQVERGSLYSTLERDMDSIFNEESAAMVRREEDAVGDMVYSGGEGGEMAWAMGRTVEAIKAGNLPETFNTMTNRLLGESEAARRFYDRRVGELSRQVGIIQARAMARDELRQMFRTKYIEGDPLTPKSDAQYIAQSVLFNNMWSKMNQAILGIAAGASYHEMKKTLDEGMQMYAQQQASTAARIIAPCAVLVYDAATGSFFPASYVSKGVTTLYSKGINNALGWLGKRLFGIGTEAAVRRAGENTALRIFGSALGGAANFATYEFESELFGGAATGTLSAGNLTHAAVGGAGKGFVFVFVGGVAGKATEGLTGFNALLGEVGTISAEGTVFTAMDFLQTGQLTPESVGTSFGMAIAGRMAHPVEYATNLLSRVVGINAKHAPSKPPRISKEMQARLQGEYPALTALLSGDGLAKDIAKAIKTNGGKQNAQDRLNAIEEEYRRLKFDKNVPWGVVRIAEYVVNGRVIPQPWMMNSEIRTDGDGNEYGVTLDGEGRTIEEYRFRNEKDRDKWLATTSRQSDINRLMVANQNLRRSEFTDILESTINEVAEAQGMDANVLRDVVRGGDIKKKEYRKTIKDKAYLSAAEEVQKAVDAKLESTESAADIALRAVENKYGISIEQALEYPVYQRTEREAKAVEELQQRLNGDYSPENDMSDAELIEAEKAEARDEGYNTEGGDRADLKDRLEDAAASLSGMGINPADIDKMDDAALAQWMQERDMDAETAAAVMEYQNAKAAFEGVRDRLQDDAQKRIEESNRQTDERTNSGSGMIHRVTVKPDNENDPAREGFVIEGKIAVNEDGTVDLEGSDKEVVVAYSDGSKPEMRPISDVLTGEQPLDPKEVKQQTADVIMTELTEKAASDMNRDLPFNLGDVYDVMIEGQPAKATVVGEDPQQPGNVVVDFSNGQRGSVAKEALQGMADDYREAQRRPQQPVKEETPVEEEQPQQANERDAKPAQTEERPAAPPVGGDPAERVAYYRASGKSEERIAKEIANNLAAARERLEKAQKEWEESTETDDAVLDALERARDEAKREVEYWEEVGRIRDTAPEEEVIEEQPAGQPAEEPLRSDGTESLAPGFSEADKKFWSREGEDIVEVMDEAARQMGLAVVTYDDPNGENGYIQGGKIYLNSAKGRAAIGFVMGHEMTHEMQERDKANGENGNLYTQFRELALEHAKSVFTPRRVKGVMCNTYEDYLNARYNQYQEHIRETTRNREFEKAWKSGLSNEEAAAIAERAAEKAASEFTMDDLMDETVSDVAGSMLADPDMARRVLGLEKDLDRLHKYKEAIMDWLEKILARMTGRGEEYEQMKRLQQSLQDLWSDAVKKNRGDRSQDQRRRYSLDTHAQQFGLRYEKGEDGSTHFYEDLGRDADGNPILGREITRFMPVHIENSPVGAVLRQGLKDGIIDKEQYNRTIQNQCAIMQYFKDTADLDTFFAVSGAIGFAQMPPTGNEKVMRDYYRMDKQGRAVFVPYKSNSETQYGNTFDVTTICRKTQTMIDVMSETMKAQKHGLTVDEVIKVVYDNVYKMGKGRNEDGRDIMVPCNVCYVFNRWVNLGNLFDTMRQLRDRYSDMSVEQIRKERVKNIQGLVKEYEKQGNELEYRKYADYLTALDEWANASVADRAADKAAGDITKTRLEEYGKTVAKLMKDRLVEVDSELDALNIKLFNYERAANKADAEKFTAADRKRMEQLKNEKNYLEKGTWFDYVRLQDDYKPIPDDILFDINRSYEFKEHYAGAWKYRTTRGSGMGKAAAAYSPEYFGSGIVGAAMDADSARDMSKNLFMVREPGTDGKWHYKYIDEETWTLKPEAVKLLRKAQDKAAAQNYLNGQRFQSTSDARVEYLTDYNTYMLEQMLIGSKGQGFTKVPECAKLFGDTGTMFNLSLIAKGKGYEDLTQEQYEALDEEDKKDCAMIDGVWRHALYSDVSGINHGDAFALSDAYPNLQPIMVTINNIHARLCMALASTGRITFNIPYHASGDTESYYLSKAETTGDSMDMTSRADYSDYETDKIIDPDDKTAATARNAFAKIKTGADLTKAEMAYLRNLDHDNVLRQLYMRFRGEDVDGGPARILNKYLVETDRDTAGPGYGSLDSQCRIQEWDGKTGEFLTDADGNPVYKQVKLSGGKDGTANLLMTNDYWDKTLTLAQADQNGQAFLDLCEQLGYRPRFSGWKKDKNKGWMYDPDFDFTKCTGYWSNLIDISMYDQQGNPITQGKIDASAIGTPHFKKNEMTDLNGRRLTAMEANPGIDSEVMRDIVRQNVTDVAARRAREKAEFAQIVRDWANDKRGNKGALFGGKRGDIIPSWIRNEWDRNPQFVKEVAKMAKLSPEVLERQKARNIEDAIQHAQDTMDEYYGETGGVDATPRWSLVDDPVERKRMADVEFSRMGEEERGELIDESRRFSLSTDLYERYGSRWIDEQTEESGKHTTQVPSTIGSYRKFADFVKRDSGGRDDVRVLDASSGLGHGTRWMRENGINAEDVEPYPSKDREAPTYASYDDVKDDYDYIISNCVLNVIPEDWRRDVLHNMADKLKVGGKMIINVRGADSIRKQGTEGKSRITLDDPSEILVLRPNGSIRAYQKGFTKQELKGWCENELGDGYQVEVAGKKNAGDSYDTAVVITRTGEGGKKYSLDEKYRSKTDEEMASGSVPFNGNLRGDKESRFKVIDDENKRFLNWRGNEQKRYKRNVGKEMGNGVYVHKDYAEDIVPADVLEKAKAIAEREGFKYNSVYYEKKKPNMVRFDEAPDFDTAREPIPGKWMWVDTETGNIGKTGESNQIWHNKWMWVKDDYKGFDVNEAYEWSKTWNQRISNPDGASYKWEYLLKQADLPVDWSGSALSNDYDGVRFSLSEEQREAQTHSENFKKWFGDWENDPDEASKVVDSDGRPKVVLHGTPNNEFYAFDPEKAGSNTDQGWLGKGFYFYGNAPEYASQYAGKNGRVLKVYLDIKNPYIATVEDFNRLAEANNPEESRRFRERLEEEGYDGVFYNGDLNEEWVAFRPEQIKSATENNGDFSRENPDIRYQLSEDAEGWQSEQVSWERSALDHLLQNAARNAESKNLRSQAVQAVNSTLADLLRRISQTTDRGAYNSVEATNVFTGAVDNAMNAQRGYDRWTVDSLVSMAKSMLKSGLYDGLRASEVNRLVAKINEGAGREEIQEQMATVYDVLMDANLRGWDNLFKKLMQTKAVTKNASGVQVQGKMDAYGGSMIKAMSEAMELDETHLAQRISDCIDRMGDPDPSVSKYADAEYEGLMLAQQYVRDIASLKQDIASNKADIRREEERIYDFFEEPMVDGDGNPVLNKLTGEPRVTKSRRLKEEFKRSMTDENKAIRKRTEDTIKALRQANRGIKADMAEAYVRMTDSLGAGVGASVKRAKEWRERQKEHEKEILHNINSDIKGSQVAGQARAVPEGILEGSVNNTVLKAVQLPAQTFEKFMRFLGKHAYNGEGYLFQRYMRGYMNASDQEFNRRFEAMQMLDQKIGEVFDGDKLKRAKVIPVKIHLWRQLYDLEKDHKQFPPIKVSYWSRGEFIEDVLSQGEATYLYMVNKQEDGKMKLRTMGISEEDIQAIKEQVDPRFIELADWLQNEFLPSRRTLYSDVYERMFGVPMPKVENYVHLKIADDAIEKTDDINTYDMDGTNPSTVTGSIIKRSRNTKAIDIHTDAFDLIARDIDDMEHWAAFAEFNRDINTMKNYGRLRSALKHTRSLEFGGGEENILKAFDNACAIVAGAYKPTIANDKWERATYELMKMSVGACIAFRNFTGLKQLLSIPSFFSEASAEEIAKHINPVSLLGTETGMGDWKWAMENLPGFKKRWYSRQMGDPRMFESDLGLSRNRRKIANWVSHYGIWFNARNDATAVAAGARAVYETRKKQYLKDGYDEAKADEKAKFDAWVAYNNSQQSAESAFVAPVQLNRTFINMLYSMFRTASMGYSRKNQTAMRNLKYRIASLVKGGDYDQKSIEFMSKLYEREGLTKDQADARAERVYNRGKYKAMFDMVLYSYVLTGLWNFGKQFLQSVDCDDEEVRKKAWGDIAAQMTFGPIEGWIGGDVMSDVLTDLWTDKKVTGDSFEKSHPFVSEFTNIINKFGTDKYEAVNMLVNLACTTLTGANPSTVSDAFVGVLDAFDGDFDAAREFWIAFYRFNQFPQSQIDEVYLDELGIWGKDIKKTDAATLAKRYANYMRKRKAPYTDWARDDAATGEANERYMKAFDKKVMARMEGREIEWLEDAYNKGDDYLKELVGKTLKKSVKDVEDNELTRIYDTTTNEAVKSATRSELAKRMGGEDPYDGGDKAYEKAYLKAKKSKDMEEDIALAEAQKAAKVAGDTKKAKAIEAARKRLTENFRSKLKGDEDDEKIMERLREARAKLIDKYVKDND